MEKLLQIGHYFATGGVSVHIKRLVDLMQDDYDINIIDESRLIDNDGVMFNIRNKQIFKYINLIRKADIIHIHSSNIYLRFLHIITSWLFRKRIIVTIHSLTLIKSKNKLLFLKLVLKMASVVIVVNKEIKQILGMENLIVMPAFLPPNLSDKTKLPDDIKKYLKKNVNKKIIIGNAFRLNIYNNQDLYGTDLLIKVAERIKQNKDEIKIIFIITTLEINKKLYYKYTDEIKAKGLESQIKLVQKPISFVKLIEECDIVVRPTNTDGDALTIREALFLNKPIIASDVVKRPEGTILFKNRDSEDLYKRIKEVINKDNLIINYPKIDYKFEYKKIYSNNI